MKSIIVCDDHGLATKIADFWCRVGFDAVAPQIVPFESCVAVLLADSNANAAVVFLAGRQFGSTELARVKQLCEIGDHAKVVAIGPAHGPQIVLEAVRNGAADFLDIGSEFEAQLRNFAARLTRAPANRAGHLISVFSAAGGTGTSTLAVNLAAALAKQGTACLLDFQMRGGDLAALLKCQPRHNILSLADKAHQLDRAMFDQSLIKHDCGIHLLASPQLFSEHRQIVPQVVQQVVQFAVESYPNVVVELEDLEHAEQVRTVAASHRIILLLRLDFVALSRTRKCIDFLLNAKVAPERIVLVAGRTGQPKEMPVETCAEVLGLPINHRIPEDSASVNMAVNLGTPVLDLCPKSAIAASIVKLAAEITGTPASTSEPEQGIWRRRASLAAGVAGLVLSSFQSTYTRK